MRELILGSQHLDIKIHSSIDFDNGERVVASPECEDELTFKPLNLISIFSHRGWLHCQTKSEIDTEVHKFQTTGAELGVKDDTSGKF